MNKNDKILLDLTNHLHNRVMEVVSDHMDTCRRANLRYRDVATDLLLFFSHLASGYAAFQFNVEEDDFVQVMRMQFRKAQNKIKEDES
jgi:hypothetical protein